MDEPPLTLPELAGARIRLRAFAERDLPAVLEAATDPLIPVLTTVPSEPDRALAAAFLERQHDRLRTRMGYSFAIADEHDRAVGQIGLWLRDLDRGRVSIGYWIVPSARRQGHAVDALTTITAWGAGLDEVHRLELYVEPWNRGSWRTAERAGYHREGLLRSWERIGDERRDLFMYSRLAAEVLAPE